MPARRVEAATATTLTLGGRELLSFAGTGYLGLAHHPEVIEAAREALGRCGLSAGASRVTSGSFEEHEALEEALARFLRVDAALVTTDGWLADEAVLEAHGPELGAVLLDRNAHDSLRVAARLVDAPVEEFDAGALEAADGFLARHPGARVAALTDGVFPMRQRIADLPALLSRVGDAGLLLVDDSHALGMLGEGGRGSASHHGITDARLVTAGSLAKSLGASGGVVAGCAERVERVRAGAEAFASTTPVPPAVAAGARAALAVLEREPERHARQVANARRLGELGRRLGREPNPTAIPVLAVPVPDAERGAALERALASAGIFVPWTTYGGGAGDLRLAVTSEHAPEDLDRLASVLEAALS